MIAREKLVLAFLVLSSLSPGGVGAARAAEASSTASVVDPHATHLGFHFKDQAMDFVFGSLALGSAVNHGVEIGEAFTTAAAITDGDAESWSEAWLRTAALIEARGETAAAGGHLVSARDQELRASYAYRIALAALPPDDPRFKASAEKSRASLREAGQRLDPKLEYVEIPFENGALPGYFRKAAPAVTPAKTLVMIGGAETFAEDQYFYIAPQAFDRGYNFLTVDLPGQGLLPLDGRVFRADIDAPLKAVLDYALSRRDVDPARLALYGISSGGGFVGQAAVRDRRVSAVVMNNCVVDAGAGVAKMAVATATPEVVAGWSSFSRISNQLIAWRFGVAPDNLPGLVAANRDFRFDPAKLNAPTLIVVAGGEMGNPEIARQTEICARRSANPRTTLVVTPEVEGAANHVVMENRSLMAQVVFDWLDETFAP